MSNATGMWIALGLITAAWITKIVVPSSASNAAGWVFGVLGALIVVLAALGVPFLHHLP